MKNLTKQKIDTLYKKIAPLQQEIKRLEQTEQLNVQIPRLQNMVGFCLRSNYDNNKNTYARILDLIKDKSGHYQFLLECLSIQSNCNPYIHLDNVTPYINKEWWDVEIPISGWEKCNVDEYNKFKELVLTELQTQSKIRKVMKNYKY